MRGTKSTWMKALAMAWAMVLGLQVCIPLSAQGRSAQSPMAEQAEAGLQAADGLLKDAVGHEAGMSFADGEPCELRVIARADRPRRGEGCARSALLPAAGCFPAAP